MADVVKPQPGDEITSAWGQSVANALNGIQAGQVAVSVASGSNGTAVVVFPKPYAAPPVIVTSVRATNSNTSSHSWIAGAGVTATQATVAAGRDDTTSIAGTTIQVCWVAIGVLA